MSGHSKWATIHRQKEITDAKKGQAWTKITNAIIVAIRENGGNSDPNTNFRLRLAIDKGRQVNMPNENIQRAIERAGGAGGPQSLEEIVYEGYGPGGTAVMVEAMTDNKNRTAQEIKNIFERGGGTLAGKGAVAFQFTPMGYLTMEKPANLEEALLQIMDMGVDEVEETDDVIEIYTQPENLETVKNELTKNNYQIRDYELTMKPNVTVAISDSALAQKVLNFMENLENQNEVQKVYANFDVLS